MNSKIFKALGNETRLRIIQTLMIKEHNVSDLTTISGKDQTTISRHLATLVNAGLITQKKIGRNVFYNIIGPAIYPKINIALFFKFIIFIKTSKSNSFHFHFFCYN